MPITLSELMKLREDKQSLARIDELLERRARAIEAVEKARNEIAEVAAALAALGIAIEDDATQPATAAPARRAAARGPRATPAPRQAGRRKAADSETDDGSRRSGSEYEEALDMIGQMFLNEGRHEVKGRDVLEQMTARGFGSEQGVMTRLRAHPRWRMSGERRGARYHYDPLGDQQETPRKPRRRAKR